MCICYIRKQYSLFVYLFVCLFVCVGALPPSQYFLVMLGRVSFFLDRFKHILFQLGNMYRQTYTSCKMLKD